MTKDSINLIDQKLGLSSTQVLEKQKIFGPNVLMEKKGRTPLRIFLEQFRSPLIHVFFAAGIMVVFLAMNNLIHYVKDRQLKFPRVMVLQTYTIIRLHIDNNRIGLVV